MTNIVEKLVQTNMTAVGTNITQTLSNVMEVDADMLREVWLPHILLQFHLANLDLALFPSTPNLCNYWKLSQAQSKDKVAERIVSSLEKVAGMLGGTEVKTKNVDLSSVMVTEDQSTR